MLVLCEAQILDTATDPSFLYNLKGNMPGRWLRKLNKLADKVSDNLVEKVQNKVEATLGSLSLDDLGPVVTKLKSTADTCHQRAQETNEICQRTSSQRQEMIDFAQEIQSTLSNVKDASVMDTIQQLTDGKRIASAIQLAKGLDETALQCVDKSIEMIDALEEGVDALPPVLQQAMDHAASDDGFPDEDGDGIPDHELLKTVGRDIEDVQTCIKELGQLNLATAFRVGLQAFTELTKKAQVSKDMLDHVQSFAQDVQDITDSFRSMNPSAIASKSKDLLRCLRATDVMRHLALAARKLIEIIIQLFQATAERISVLWKALAFAKDCMTDCVQHVRDAQTRCVTACERSTVLMEKSRNIQVSLEEAGTINMKTIGAVRELKTEMENSIELAKNMDNMVVECTDKVANMVDRVVEGFRNLPDILTQDIDDIPSNGKVADDPEPIDLEQDVTELEEAHRALDESNLVQAARAGASGFAGVSTKSSVARDQLNMIKRFAEHCQSTIDDFLHSSWDLQSAANKIADMCRIVSLGELMKVFAAQVKRLVIAMVEFMKSAVTKFSNLDVKELAGDVGESLVEKVDDLKDLKDQAIDHAKEKLEDMKDKFKFWK